MMDILMGVGGGRISDAFGGLGDSGGLMVTTRGAMMGPVLGTAPTAYVNGSRNYARQL